MHPGTARASSRRTSWSEPSTTACPLSSGASQSGHRVPRSFRGRRTPGYRRPASRDPSTAARRLRLSGSPQVHSTLQAHCSAKDDYLLTEERSLSDRAMYHFVVAAIASGNTNQTGVARALGREQRSVQHPLRALEAAEFVVATGGRVEVTPTDLPDRRSDCPVPPRRNSVEISPVSKTDAPLKHGKTRAAIPNPRPRPTLRESRSRVHIPICVC